MDAEPHTRLSSALGTALFNASANESADTASGETVQAGSFDSAKMSAGPQRTTYGPRKRHRRVRRPSLSLVDHLVSSLTACEMDPVEHRLRDPAAGGAAFLVPLARIKMAAWRKWGLDDAEIARRLRVHLVGREIESELAT